MRRMSGPMLPRKSSHSNVLPNNLHAQRRHSEQTDGSQQYLPPNMNQFTTSQQSRFHCIQSQKAPLRNVLSAPQSNMNIDFSRNMQPQQHFSVQIPPQSLMQRQDSTCMQSLESIDSMSASLSTELARYKTELCRPFEETGECRYGNKCQFAHGMNELRSLNRHPKYKTEFCRTYHTTGFCSYGQRCNFIHNDDERRGPVPMTRVQPMSQQKPAVPLMLPITAPLTIASTGDSPTSSICGGSPSQSHLYLMDDVFPSAQRLSPTPSFGSDGNSLASSGSLSPPASPKHENAFSPLELGFSLALFSGLSL